jgi:hypothetical protein
MWYTTRLSRLPTTAWAFLLSDFCPTIRLDAVFTPGEYDVYEELCVGVILASAETYGSLANLCVVVSLNKIC